jgi:hypothetical protein
MRRALAVLALLVASLAPASPAHANGDYSWSGHVVSVPATPAHGYECAFLYHVARSITPGQFSTYTYGSADDASIYCGDWQLSVPAYTLVVHQVIWRWQNGGWVLVNGGVDVWSNTASHSVDTGFTWNGWPTGQYMLASYVWLYGYGGKHQSDLVWVS